MESKSVLKGFAIVVADNGFVYVGEVEHDGTWCVITRAKNIRYWGTKNGLGQLALEGPQQDTKLDVIGTVRVPSHAVIHIIDTNQKLWLK